MATPTWAEAATNLKNGVKPYTDLLTIFPTIVTSIDVGEQSAEGEFQPAGNEAAHAQLRSDLTAAYGRDRVRRVWDAWFREVMRIAGLPFTNPGDEAGWARLHRYMTDNSYSFNDRDWTRGAPSAVSGTGTGTLKRLTVDWEAYNLQHGHVETKTFECIADANLGRLNGDEVFQVRGEDASKDALDYQGSGLLWNGMGAMNCGGGAFGSRLSNPSLDATFSGTGTDKIPGWVIGGTAAKVIASTSSNIFRRAPGVTTANSNGVSFEVDAAATNEITQALDIRRINALGERTPWMLQAAFKMTNAAATGTINLKIGNKTTAQSLAGWADTAWHVLQFTVDKNLYYRNWKENAPDIEIEMVSLSVGSVYCDDIIFAPWTKIDGTWWWLAGGATDFLQRDVITAADTGPTAAASEMMYAADYARLPHSLPSATAAGETITDP